MILKTLVGRVVSKGDAVLAEGQSFYVCDGCGFIYAGAEAPAVCPICKAPASRFAAY
jgi:rubrerythrin